MKAFGSMLSDLPSDWEKELQYHGENDQKEGCSLRAYHDKYAVKHGLVYDEISNKDNHCKSGQKSDRGIRGIRGVHAVLDKCAVKADVGYEEISNSDSDSSLHRKLGVRRSETSSDDTASTPKSSTSTMSSVDLTEKGTDLVRLGAFRALISGKI